MDQYVTRIRTESGDLQIDYNSLANLPHILKLDKTLSVSGEAADSQIVGSALSQKASTNYVDEQVGIIGDQFNNIDNQLDEIDDQIGVINKQISDINTQIYLQGAPHNYIVNSDFTRFVAQDGVGACSFENNFFAGDRWLIADEANSENIQNIISGTSHRSGEGYTQIKLNGTITQIVLDEFEDNNFTCGVETISGTATASYNNKTHEFRITSNGGIIKNAWLYKGIFENVPVYKPKGFATELSECQKYFQIIRNGYGYTTQNRADIFVPTTILRRLDVDNQDIFMSDERKGFIIVDGNRISVEGLIDAERYLPSELRIGLRITYSGVDRAAFLWNTKIYIDTSPEIVDYFK